MVVLAAYDEKLVDLTEKAVYDTKQRENICETKEWDSWSNGAHLLESIARECLADNGHMPNPRDSEQREVRERETMS